MHNNFEMEHRYNIAELIKERRASELLRELKSALNEYKGNNHGFAKWCLKNWNFLLEKILANKLEEILDEFYDYGFYERITSLEESVQASIYYAMAERYCNNHHFATALFYIQRFSRLTKDKNLAVQLWRINETKYLWQQFEPLLFLKIQAWKSAVLSRPWEEKLNWLQRFWNSIFPFIDKFASCELWDEVDQIYKVITQKEVGSQSSNLLESYCALALEGPLLRALQSVNPSKRVSEKITKFQPVIFRLIAHRQFALAYDICLLITEKITNDLFPDIFELKKKIANWRGDKKFKKYKLPPFTALQNQFNTPLPDWIGEVLRKQVAELREKRDKQFIVREAYSIKIQRLLKIILEKLVALLGDAPCKFSIINMGSLARREMGIYSDIEIAVLVAEPDFRNHLYFKKILDCFGFLLDGIGDCWIRFDKTHQWLGMQVDRDLTTVLGIFSNQGEYPLLNTPTGLAEWVGEELSGENYFVHAYALLQPVVLYDYQDSRLVEGYYQQLTKWMIKNLNNWLYARIKRADSHSKDYQALMRNLSVSELVDFKKTYLAPVIRWCSNIAWKYDLIPQIDIHSTSQIIARLRVNRDINESFIKTVETCLSKLLEIRDRLEADNGYRLGEIVAVNQILSECNLYKKMVIDVLYYEDNVAYLTGSIFEKNKGPWDPWWVFIEGKIEEIKQRKNNNNLKEWVDELVSSFLWHIFHFRCQEAKALCTDFFYLLPPDIKQWLLSALETIQVMDWYISIEDKLLLQTLLGIFCREPLQDGWRIESSILEQQWETSINLLGEGDRIDENGIYEKINQGKIVIGYFDTQGNTHYRSLRTDLVSKWVDEKWCWRKSNQISMHQVFTFTVDNQQFWVKLFPEQSGTEMAVYALTERLVGSGTLAKSQVMVAYHQGCQEGLAILLSRHVEGKNLSEIFTELGRKPLPLSTAEFTRHFLRVVVTDPEDDKDNDYMGIIESDNHQLKLVRIDYDRSFFSAIFCEPKTVFGYEYSSALTLQIKSIIYCLNGMSQALDHAILKEFSRLDIPLLISKWLMDLINIHSGFSKLFSKAQRATHFAPKNTDLIKWGGIKVWNEGNCGILTVLLADELAVTLLKRLILLQDIVKYFDKKKEYLTGAYLLEVLQPELAEYYKSFQNCQLTLQSEQERFYEITKTLYQRNEILSAESGEKKIITRTQKTSMVAISNQIKRKTLSIELIENSFKNNENSPHIALEMLNRKSFENLDIHNLIRNLISDNGNIRKQSFEQLRELFQFHQLLIYQEFLKLIKEGGVTRQRQESFFENIHFIKFIVLNISAFKEVLTEKRLENFLSSFKKELQGLRQLTFSGTFSLYNKELSQNLKKLVIVNFSSLKKLEIQAKWPHLECLIIKNSDFQNIQLITPSLTQFWIESCPHLTLLQLSMAGEFGFGRRGYGLYPDKQIKEDIKMIPFSMKYLLGCRQLEIFHIDIFLIQKIAEHYKLLGCLALRKGEYKKSQQYFLFAHMLNKDLILTDEEFSLLSDLESWIQGFSATSKIEAVSVSTLIFRIELLIRVAKELSFTEREFHVLLLRTIFSSNNDWHWLSHLAHTDKILNDYRYAIINAFCESQPMRESTLFFSYKDKEKEPLEFKRLIKQIKINDEYFCKNYESGIALTEILSRCLKLLVMRDCKDKHWKFHKESGPYNECHHSSIHDIESSLAKIAKTNRIVEELLDFWFHSTNKNFYICYGKTPGTLLKLSRNESIAFEAGRVLPILLERLSLGTYSEKFFSIVALGKLGYVDSRVISSLIKNLEDEDKQIKKAAISSLIALHQLSPLVIETLLSFLKLDTSNITLSALEFFSYVRDPSEEVLKIIISNMASGNEEIRKQSSKTLSQLLQGSPELLTKWNEEFTDLLLIKSDSVINLFFQLIDINLEMIESLGYMLAYITKEQETNYILFFIYAYETLIKNNPDSFDSFITGASKGIVDIYVKEGIFSSRSQNCLELVSKFFMDPRVEKYLFEPSSIGAVIRLLYENGYTDSVASSLFAQLLDKNSDEIIKIILIKLQEHISKEKIFEEHQLHRIFNFKLFDNFYGIQIFLKFIKYSTGELSLLLTTIFIKIVGEVDMYHREYNNNAILEEVINSAKAMLELPEHAPRNSLLLLKIDHISIEKVIYEFFYGNSSELFSVILCLLEIDNKTLNATITKDTYDIILTLVESNNVLRHLASIAFLLHTNYSLNNFVDNAVTSLRSTGKELLNTWQIVMSENRSSFTDKNNNYFSSLGEIEKLIKVTGILIGGFLIKKNVTSITQVPVSADDISRELLLLLPQRPSVKILFPFITKLLTFATTGENLFDSRIAIEILRPLIKLYPDIIQTLLELLSEGEPIIREGAALVIGGLIEIQKKKTNLLELIMAATISQNDSDKLLRTEISGLVRGSSDVADGLEKALDDHSLKVRIATIKALYKLKPITSTLIIKLMALGGELCYRWKELKFIALIYPLLGEIGKERSDILAYLKLQLKNRYGACRAAVIRGIIKYQPQDEGIVKELIEYLNDEDKEVRIAAVKAIGKLQRRSLFVLKHVIERLKDKEVFPFAVATLGKMMPTPENIETLVRFFFLTEDFSNRDKIKKSLKSLSKKLAENNPKNIFSTLLALRTVMDLAKYLYNEPIWIEVGEKLLELCKFQIELTLNTFVVELASTFKKRIAETQPTFSFSNEVDTHYINMVNTNIVEEHEDYENKIPEKELIQQKKISNAALISARNDSPINQGKKNKTCEVLSTDVLHPTEARANPR